ncbi:MAG: hypothetical protein WC048_15165 [Rhizobium sp.]
MLSEELTQQVKAMAEKYRQRQSNIIWAVNRFPDHRQAPNKPRIRVKANSRRWSLP